MPDLLFDWFGFGLTSKSVDNFTQARQLNYQVKQISSTLKHTLTK